MFESIVFWCCLATVESIWNIFMDSLCVVRLSFWAVGAGRGSCAPGPGWRCSGIAPGCTGPPPPAASSAEPLRNPPPCRSSAAVTHRADERHQKHIKYTHNVCRRCRCSAGKSLTRSKSCRLTLDKLMPRPPLACKPPNESEKEKWMKCTKLRVRAFCSLCDARFTCAHVAFFSHRLRGEIYTNWLRASGSLWGRWECSATGSTPGGATTQTNRSLWRLRQREVKATQHVVHV